MTVYELEAELLPDGLESDLRILERIFIDEYVLEPQPLTKFERAMKLAQERDHETADHSAHESKSQKSKERKTSNNGVTSPAAATATAQTTDEYVEPLLESGLPGPTVVEGVGDAGAPTRNLSADRAPTTPTPASEAAHQSSAAHTRVEGNAKSQHPGRALLDPTDSINTAGRKIVHAYFDDMLANEKGTISGEDPEALHDMRVATRRMRAVLRVLGPYLREAVQPK